MSVLARCLDFNASEQDAITYFLYVLAVHHVSRRGKMYSAGLLDRRGELSESFEIISESIGLRLRLDRAKS